MACQCQSQDVPKEPTFFGARGPVITEDTEDYRSDNKWSVNHYLAGRAKKDDMEQKFCMKTLSDGILNWPKGKYCILKKGPCPKGW